MSYIDVIGVGPIPVNEWEYTSPYIKEKYEEYMTTIKNIFNKKPPEEITREDYEELMKAMSGLAELMKNGDQTGSRTYYLPKDLLGYTKVVFEKLALFGLTPGETPSDPIQAIKDFQRLSEIKSPVLIINDQEITFADLLNIYAFHTSGSTKSLQEMVATIFIHEVMGRFNIKMADLEKRFRLSDDILQQLQILQNIANKVKIPDTSDFEFPPKQNSHIPADLVDALAKFLNSKEAGLGDAFKKAYQSEGPSGKGAAKIITDYYNRGADEAGSVWKEISKYFEGKNPIPNPDANTGKELLAAQKKLIELLAELKKQNPDAAEEENSLAYTLDKIIKSIDDSFKGIDTRGKSPEEIEQLFNEAAGRWILDNQTLAPNSGGKNLNNIAQAINMAQTTSDEQMQELEKVKTVLDEYLKTAAMILETLNKIITKMAQGIAR